MKEKSIHYNAAIFSALSISRRRVAVGVVTHPTDAAVLLHNANSYKKTKQKKKAKNKFLDVCFDEVSDSLIHSLMVALKELKSFHLQDLKNAQQYMYLFDIFSIVIASDLVLL